MTEPTLDKLNQLINSYINQYNLVERKERELEKLKEQLNELANKTIPKALAELGVAKVKIDEGFQVAEFKPYREHADPLQNPNDCYIRYWAGGGGHSQHDPEISIEMKKPKPSMTCADCADCAHYDNCSLRDHIPDLINSNSGMVRNPQLIDVIKNAPNDCPRIKNGEFAAATFCIWLYSVLFSDATKEQPHRMPWPHRMPCEEDR